MHTKKTIITSRPARSSDFQKDKLACWLFDTITGPGIAARVAADAKLPKKFPGNDGIRFDPKWQE